MADMVGRFVLLSNEELLLREDTSEKENTKKAYAMFKHLYVNHYQSTRIISEEVLQTKSSISHPVVKPFVEWQ